MTAPERSDPVLRARLQVLLDSYRHFTGESLCSSVDELFAAPFVVLAHGTESPPRLWYGNQRALDLWGYSFADWVGMPSRETAEPDLREVRERLLAQVHATGFIRDYTGIRVARDRSRFEIQRATVWNLVNAGGQIEGQAATFREVRRV